MMLRKYCWKNEFETCGSAPAKLLTTSKHTGRGARQSANRDREQWARTVQSSLRNISHRVLDGPDDAVHEKLELRRKDGQERCDNSSGTRSIYEHARLTREAVQIDCSQQLEEADAVLWELGKVLVDHVQSRLEHGVENGGDLRGKYRLRNHKSVSIESMTHMNDVRPVCR